MMSKLSIIAAMMCLYAHCADAQYLAVGMPLGTSGPLTLYTSTDGLYFQNVSITYANAPPRVRNPFIVASYNLHTGAAFKPVLIGGHYWLTHSTTGCCDEQSYQATSFALARTVGTNLRHWVFVKNVDASIGVDGQYTWNPAPFISDDGVLHVINAIGCCITGNYNMSEYEQHPLDSNHPEGDWSAPALIPGLLNPVIDGTLIEDEDGRVNIFFKNDNFNITTIEAATAWGNNLFGPYNLDRVDPNWAGWEGEGPVPICGRESPSILKIGADWRVYMLDWCPDGNDHEKYSIMSNTDWSWTPQQPIIQIPFESQAMQFYQSP